MRSSWRIVTGAVVVSAIIAVTGCSPEIATLYRVDGASVDIAPCDEFEASSVVIEFGDYPLLQGLQNTATRRVAGNSASFGNGVPVSLAADWTIDPSSEAVPEKWDRVDFSFYDDSGAFVHGQFVFHRDIDSSNWSWSPGRQDCVLNVNPVQDP